MITGLLQSWERENLSVAHARELAWVLPFCDGAQRARPRHAGKPIDALLQRVRLTAQVPDGFAGDIASEGFRLLPAALCVRHVARYTAPLPTTADRCAQDPLAGGSGPCVRLLV